MLDPAQIDGLQRESGPNPTSQLSSVESLCTRASERTFFRRIFILFRRRAKDKFHLAVFALDMQARLVQAETAGPRQGQKEGTFLIHEFAGACHPGRAERKPPDSPLTVELHPAREPVDGGKPGDLTIVVELHKRPLPRETVFVPVYGHFLENPPCADNLADILGGNESSAALCIVTSRLTAQKTQKAQGNNQEATDACHDFSLSDLSDISPQTTFVHVMPSMIVQQAADVPHLLHFRQQSPRVTPRQE